MVYISIQQRPNANSDNRTIVRGSGIEDVTQFTYLGSVISTTGGTDEDIAAREKKAQQAFAILKPIWRSKVTEHPQRLEFSILM